MIALLNALLPLLAFMLIPLWIPLIASIGGKTVDLVKVRVESE